ncbi:MAG TPA: carboxypeptidase regulatory-like domain-containing protein [Vicinamibacterales bacterium]|nr:carboxypeptidase regulatory-like domain-containing protein [Vicinamibacterales bacterium]
MVRKLPVIVVVLWLAAGSASAGAQVISGTVEGRVKDAQGGVLPGVTITAINTATATRLAGVTGSEGLYRIPFVPSGVYEVRAEMSGFRTEARQGVEVRVNDSAVVDFALPVAPVAETITVEGGSSGVQLTRSELKRTYDEAALKEIPLGTADAMGRNVYGIATKAPGVTTPGGRFGRAFLGSGGGNVVANGTTARSTNYELDGISNIDPEDNDYRTPVSVEGVKEFEVLTANYNAEFGRAGGAQVRAISKSGTNVFHGSAFEYFYDNQRFQSEATDVQPRKCTADQISGLAAAPAGGCFGDFRTNLYGGTAGGPAIPDRLFYFGMFENNIRRGTNASTGSVPLATERTINAGTARADEIVGEWLALYPLPNREAINPRRYQANVPFAYDTPNVFGRVDYNQSASTRLMARYDFRNQDYKITRIFRGNGGDIADRGHTGGVVLTRVFSPTTLGEFRFGYGYRRVELPIEPGFESFPTITVAGFGTLGPISVQYPIARQLYDVQAAGSFAHSRGRHAYKAGYDVHRIFNNGVQSDHARGTISFGVGYGRSGIENLLAGTPTSYTATIGDPRRNFRVWDLGLFVQDDVRLLSNLTLNLGLRLESITEWKEKDGLTDFGYGADLINPAPRVGAVWDVAGDGRWVVRGAYGLSYDRVNFFFLRSLQFQAPHIRTITLLPTTEPLRVESLGPTAGQVQSGPIAKTEVDPDFHLGRVHTWNATVERRLGRTSSMRVSYVGTASRDVPATLILNRAVPTADATFANRQARRPDPSFSNISRLANASEGNYKGLQTTFDRRVSAGFQMQVSYTLSEALDMASDPGFGSGDNYLAMNEAADRTFVTDRARGMELRKADLYGPSRFDMRHVGSVTGSYQLPWKRRAGVVGAIVSDWAVSGSAHYRDGVPFTVFCSANGGDCNLDGQGQDRASIVDAGVLGTQIDGYPRAPVDTARIYIPIGAFDQTTCRQAGATANCVEVGAAGTQGRNSFRYDDFFSVDFALVRTIPTAGTQRAQVRLEMFNLFNQHYAGNPSLSFALPDNFGRVFGTNGNRSWQVGLRYDW